MPSTGSSPESSLGPTPPAAAIAFFDLDGTLLACNSAVTLLLDGVRDGHIRPLAALRGLGWLACHRLGYADLERVLMRSHAALAGRDAAEAARRTAACYERALRRRLRPGGLAVIAAHRARGDRCVLLTTATQHLSELVVNDLALDAALCTVLEIDTTQSYTGRVVGPLCFGTGKAAVAAAFAARCCVPLAACTFYSDSVSDLPALELVGRPVAVHPDPRLRRIAASRRWPIVDWSHG